jgi:hypothetical protein
VAWLKQPNNSSRNAAGGQKRLVELLSKSGAIEGQTMKPVFLLLQSDAGKSTFLNVAQIEEIHAGDSPGKSIVYMIGDRDRGTYLVVNSAIQGILDALAAVCDVVIPTQTKQPSGITG